MKRQVKRRNAKEEAERHRIKDETYADAGLPAKKQAVWLRNKLLCNLSSRGCLMAAFFSATWNSL